MDSSEEAGLARAVERLYEVFSPYTPPRHPAFCTHCVSDAEDAILHSKPLRQLSRKELARFSFKAISTWGTVEQFKYLLPRLFELTLQEGFGYNPEILFKKPRYGDFASWPELEQKALRAYCDALWRFALAHYPLTDLLQGFASIGDCLCSVAQIVDDVHPLLQVWNSETESATLHLSDFIVENAWALKANKLSNAFWDERPEQVKQIVDWFATLEFAVLLDLAELSTLPREVAIEVVQAVRRRTK
jgi:hypothetical protein